MQFPLLLRGKQEWFFAFTTTIMNLSKSVWAYTHLDRFVDAKRRAADCT